MRVLNRLYPTQMIAPSGCESSVLHRRISIVLTARFWSAWGQSLYIRRVRVMSAYPPAGSSHYGRTPAIDVDRGAGNLAALLRRQEAREVGEFLGLADAPERNLLFERLVVLLDRHIGPLCMLHMLVGAN